MQTLVIIAGVLAVAALALRIVGALAPVSRRVQRALRIGNIIAALAAVVVAAAAFVAGTSEAAAFATPTCVLVTFAAVATVFGAGAVFTTLPYGASSTVKASAPVVARTRHTSSTSGSDDATNLALATVMAVEVMASVDTGSGS